MTETRDDRQPKSNIAPTDSKLYNLTNIHSVYTNNTYEIGSGQTKKKQTDNRWMEAETTPKLYTCDFIRR